MKSSSNLKSLLKILTARAILHIKVRKVFMILELIFFPLIMYRAILLHLHQN